MTDKCYSLNDEDFFETIEELLEHMESEGCMHIGTVYYEADRRDMQPSDYIQLDYLLEHMDERACDELGEAYTKGAWDASAEAKVELHEFLSAWITKNIPRYWRVVGKSRECRVTADDMPKEQRQ